MTDDLHDALTDIRGIGDATADEILDILEQPAPEGHSKIVSLLELAHEHHEAGHHEYAAKYVRRAAESIDA